MYEESKCELCSRHACILTLCSVDVEDVKIQFVRGGEIKRARVRILTRLKIRPRNNFVR